MPNNTLGLSIDAQFRDLLPALTKEQREGLESLIAAHGFTAPITCWEDQGETWIIDGHNRYDIWLKLPDDTVAPPSVRLMQFEDRIDVELWMIDEQDGRRNVTPIQRKNMIGAKYNLIKQKHGAPLSNQNASSENEQVKLASLFSSQEKRPGHGHQFEFSCSYAY